MAVPGGDSPLQASIGINELVARVHQLLSFFRAGLQFDFLLSQLEHRGIQMQNLQFLARVI